MKIYKFPVYYGHNIIRAPDEDTFQKRAHVGIDRDGQLCVWYFADKFNSGLAKLEIDVIFTGEEVPVHYEFLGSVVGKDYVYHFFVV